MAKRVKFPLTMADGTQVRTLDELRESFDLVSVLSYYDNGRLGEWLADRYYDDEAEKISALDSSAADFKQSLCDILGASYSEHEAVSVELSDIANKNERYERLKRFTADDSILAAVDDVAFTQEELDTLMLSRKFWPWASHVYDVDNNSSLGLGPPFHSSSLASILNRPLFISTIVPEPKILDPIYLCGESFEIPEGLRGRYTFIGVNNPKVEILDESSMRSSTFHGVELSPESIIVQEKVILDDTIKQARASSADSHFSLETKKLWLRVFELGYYPKFQEFCDLEILLDSRGLAHEEMVNSIIEVANKGDVNARYILCESRVKPKEKSASNSRKYKSS